MGNDADVIMEIIEGLDTPTQDAPAATPEAPQTPPAPQGQAQTPEALAAWQAELTKVSQTQAAQGAILGQIAQAIATQQQTGGPVNARQIAREVIAEAQQGNEPSIWDIPDDAEINGATMKAVLSQYGQEVMKVVQPVLGEIQKVRNEAVVKDMAVAINEAAKRYPSIDKRALAGAVLTTVRDSNVRSIEEAVEVSAKMLMEGLSKIEYDALPEEKRREIAVRYAKEAKAKKQTDPNFNPGGGQPPSAPVSKPLTLSDTAAITARIEAGRQAQRAKAGK